MDIVYRIPLPNGSMCGYCTCIEPLYQMGVCVDIVYRIPLPNGSMCGYCTCIESLYQMGVCVDMVVHTKRECVYIIIESLYNIVSPFTMKYTCSGAFLKRVPHDSLLLGVHVGSMCYKWCASAS